MKSPTLAELQEAVNEATREIHRRSHVINRAYVRQWALDYAKQNRSHKFTRVSEQFLNAVETATKSFIINRIQCAPSKGVTLQ